VIETVLFFGLGFLLASLCALLLLPVVNRRAARLARRRIDAMLPMSVTEIAAERDALRAEFAVSQRRLERSVERVRAKRHADMEAIGARTLEIAALAKTLTAQDASLAERQAEIEQALARIAGLDRDLADAKTEGAAGLATLHALEAAHRDILDDLKATRRDRDGVRRESAFGESFPAPSGQASMDRDDAELRRRIGEVADALVRRERLPPTDAFALPAAARS